MSQHLNIVQVLQHDWFESNSDYFIDMELCTLTLQDYIHSRKTFIKQDSDLLNDAPIFVLDECSEHLRLLNIWTIISHIAQGLEYIHREHYTHRDIKPLNGNCCSNGMLTSVLYSHQMRAWKIADFGLTSETKTNVAHTTRYSRGTGGYRAPELLNENPKYTYQVDIWGLGCILYELCTKTHAFADDMAVWNCYHSSSTFQMSIIIPWLLSIHARHLSQCVREMMESDPQSRPSISALCPLFQSYCMLLDFQFVGELSSMPEYGQWKEMVGESPRDASELLLDLAEWHNTMGEKEVVVRLLNALGNKFPNDNQVKERLAEKFQVMEYWDAAIAIWTDLVDQYPSEARLVNKLAAVCKRQGDGWTFARVWKELADKHPDITRFAELHAAQLKLNLKRNNAVITAAKNGDLDHVQRLLDNGENVNMQGGDYYGSALQAASYNGLEEMVKLLLEKGADVNAQGGYYGNALQAASVDGSKAVVRLLLDEGADVTAQGGVYGNALQAASEQGNLAIVRLILDKGANVNVKGGVYGNALQSAALMGHEAVVRLLLEEGADVNSQGGLYGNALQAASVMGREVVVEVLLEKGADVNAKGGVYDNALQAASFDGDEAIVQLLLDKGADVNAQGGRYGTALQAASHRGDETILRLLLYNGADVTAKGGVYGDTLQAASARGNDAIAELLRKSGVHQ
jgi:ankyrin repeat protein